MNIAELPLEMVEERISEIYQWWHAERPGVHPRENGELAALWRRADYLYSLEQGEG